MKLLIIFILSSLFLINFSHASAKKIFKIDRPNYAGEHKDGVKYADLSVMYAVNYNKSNCQVISKNPISTSLVHRSNSKHYSSLSSNNKKAFKVQSDQYDVEGKQVEFTAPAFEKMGLSFLTVLTKSGSNCSVTTSAISNNFTVHNLRSMDMYFNLVDYPIFGLHPDKKNPIKSLKLKGSNGNRCIVGSCP